MRPLIGITCGTNALDDKASAEQDRLNRSYCRAVALAGGLPVILPNLAAHAEPDEVLARIDGLLLSGGLDVDPAVYGESGFNETVKVDPARDASEVPLIRAAIRDDMPMLGICRGIQVLNVALGGSLIQDLPTQAPSRIRHSQAEPRNVETHRIEVDRGSRLADIVGLTVFNVNSFHHQAVKVAGCGLVVTARADDGVIEAMEDPGKRFLIAVQFHPEDMTSGSVPAMRLFEALVAAAGRRA